MTEVKTRDVSDDSPRHRFLQDLAIAIARGDATELGRLVTHDVRFLPIGSSPVSGADLVCSALTRYGPSTHLQIDHLVADGRGGTVAGVVAFGRKQRAFCLVVGFGNVKGTLAHSITSYSLPLR